VTVGEIYIKLAVAFADDPKVRALARYGADAGLARDLYVQMICYCKRMLTDGFVPAEQVGLLVYPLDAEHGNQLAKQLASVLLTKEEANGWTVLAYVRRNGTREDVEQLSRVRAEAGRTGGRKSRKRPRQAGSQASGKQVAYQAAKQKGSNTVSVSVTSTETETYEQTPTGSAANGKTITQRSKRITDAYADAQPMCKWPAINGVVIHAIKSGKYADGEIRDALLRMAESGHSVTVEALRIELEGLPATRGRHRPSTTDQSIADTQALKTRLAGHRQETA
jgi:hypothetical protein